jgi:signal transduction histidine kinase
VLRVKDNGRSLAEEHLARIWQPYYQAEKSMTGEVVGMGLGLAMVANLVWSVGGECHAYNQPAGPGLVVELLLPLADYNPIRVLGAEFEKAAPATALHD